MASSSSSAPTRGAPVTDKAARKYKLPPVDDRAFALALDAYRAAVEHSRRVQLKWEPQHRALSKADEFSGIRCRHETEVYRSDKLCEWAGDMLRACARRARTFPERVYSGPGLFDRRSNAEVRAVIGKCRAAYEAIEATKIERSEVES